MFNSFIYFSDCNLNQNRNKFYTDSVIKSPLYPQNYPNALSCLWRLEVEDGYRIQVNVTSFNTGKNLYQSINTLIVWLKLAPPQLSQEIYSRTWLYRTRDIVNPRYIERFFISLDLICLKKLSDITNSRFIEPISVSPECSIYRAPIVQNIAISVHF